MVELLRAKDITLRDLIDCFDLQLMADDSFFREWQYDLEDISNEEKELLDKIKEGYINLLNYPPFLETSVRMTVLDPLLFIGSFYLHPFHIKAEESVEIISKDGETIIKGRLDTLVLKGQLWTMVIESKRVIYSVEAGLPQLLAYLIANPSKKQPSYGMITNGSEFLFTKLLWDDRPLYGTSHLFSMRNLGDLYEVLKILKHLSQLI
ncbi:MAG: restriction endonuclease subunit R [Microcystaceae cyanobacterium]